ncbi:MAG: DHHW family protein [Roseburia sp.]|nr:DHHW family protein [Roseburia sp.]MCM1098610.1 DHHW family protein [Ruminococcus flavefaciens]
MKEKGNAIFTVALLSAIVLIFTAADLAGEDRIFSETENRVLASRPEFSAESLRKGDYAGGYETYITDQFVGRDKWIALKTGMDVLLQKKEINGVYLGQDGYLLEQHLPEDYPEEEAEKKLTLLERLAEDWDADVMLAPTADNILTDRLPACAPYFPQEEFLGRVRERVGQEHYIDVFAALQEHSDEEIYYRTDHHWTSLGAYYSYLAWADFKELNPGGYDPEGMEEVTESFLGTLHSKINLSWEPDRILYFPETEERPVKVTYDFQKETDSLYERKYLDTKNKYGFFLDDNHGFVEIETDSGSGKTLFLIKDSYANCLIPLLTVHYDRIYVLDLRYFRGRLYPLLEQYASEADVLVLYNCIHFLEDFQYI